MRRPRERRRGASRCGLLLGGVGVGTVLLTGQALAHEGSGAAFEGAVGPYRLLAYDGLPAPDGGVEFAAVLQRADGRPMDGAEVTATARRPPADDVGPVRAEGIANVYRYVLPGDGPWQVTLNVVAEPGRGTARFSVHAAVPTPAARGGAADGAGSSPLPSGGLALGAAALAATAVVAAVRRLADRRRRAA